MSIGIIYGGNNGTVRGVNSYYSSSGISKVRNGVEIIRINTDLTEEGYQRNKREYKGITEFYYIGGDIENLPKELKDQISRLGYRKYSFRETLKDLQSSTYGRKGRIERATFRRGMIAGFIEVITTNHKK